MLARILGTLRGIPVSVILVSFSALFADVTVSVDWSKVKRTVDPLSYGVNGSYAYMANRTGNAAYRAGIKYAIGKPEGGTSLLRLHRQGLIGAWSSGGAWNSGTIIGGLKPLIDDKFDLMIGFDRAIGGGSNMEIQPADAAALVRIVNVTNKLGVKYWEIFNENGGAGATRGAQVKACIQAMKAVDPAIKVGGPALAFFDRAFFDAFIQAAVPDLDFVTFHGYGGGNTSGMSDAAMYDWAVGTGNSMRQMRAFLTQRSPDKYIPIQMNEYNISWDWNIVDARTTSNKGGVFSALIMATGIDNGGDVTNRWNESEAAFAFMNNQGQPYTVAHVYHLFNRLCHGEQVTTTTSDNKAVVAYATRNGARQSLVLINRSAAPQTANVSFAGWSAPGSLTRYQVWTRNGIDSSSVNVTAGANAVVLPDNSVTFLTATGATPVMPGDSRLIPPAAFSGRVLVTLHSISGRRLSSYVLDAGRGMSMQSLVRNAQRAAPRAAGQGLYLITLKSDARELHLGPFIAGARVGS